MSNMICTIPRVEKDMLWPGWWSQGQGYACIVRTYSRVTFKDGRPRLPHLVRSCLDHTPSAHPNTAFANLCQNRRQELADDPRRFSSGLTWSSHCPRTTWSRWTSVMGGLRRSMDHEREREAERERGGTGGRMRWLDRFTNEEVVE